MENQRKEEALGRISLSGQKLWPALQILEDKHFGTDILRGRPLQNFGLKNFGLKNLFPKLAGA